MSTDESLAESKLYSLSLDTIAVIVLFVSLIFPFGFIQDIPIFALAALAAPPFFLLLTLLNILFAIWIVRYYQGKTITYTVLILGFLSVVAPTAAIPLISALFGTIIFYIPTPLQFIVGVILLWKFEGPEVDFILEVEEPEPDLYGTSPTVIATIMAIVTLIVPLGYIPHVTDIILFFDWYFVGGFYGLLWLFGVDVLGPFSLHGFYFLDIVLIPLTLTLSIFNLLFALQVVRYYQGKTSRNHTIFIGVLSILFPALLPMMTTGFLLPVSLIEIIWPIPIQFAIGFILLYKVPGPEIMESVSSNPQIP